MQFEDCAFTSTVRSGRSIDGWGLGDAFWRYGGGEGGRLVVTVQATEAMTMVLITTSVSTRSRVHTAPNIEFERCGINMPQA